MLVTEIAEAIVTLLNLSPEKWTTANVQAKVVLDWATCLNKTQLQVLVVPDTCTYNLEESSNRRNVVRVNTTKSIVIMVARGFVGLDNENDVAPWSETKVLLDTRERISQYLLANPIPNLKIVELEEVAVDELEMDHRNFAAMTQIGYQVIQCGSGPGLLSSSTDSEEV
jgi:hypothetical protein